ncbi:MAG: hypothetical protein AB8B53_12125 [Flavobacteriales bacterium]
MLDRIFWISLVLLLYSCIDQDKGITRKLPPPLPKVFTEPSELQNTYTNFHSPHAINKLAEIENTHFNAYETGTSPYYGTSWRSFADSLMFSNETSLYENYLDSLYCYPDSMHCTLYAVKALQKGMDSLWPLLETHHKRIYKEHEHAGWSIAHILVKEFGWKAYYISHPYAGEFKHCNAAYETKKEYPVWNQPDIPLEDRYIIGEHDSLLTILLSNNEFGWGFSRQGYHTWVTRFTELKECIWHGAPAKRYEMMGLPLFRSTPFLRYIDYQSHVVCFPPKKANAFPDQ